MPRVNVNIVTWNSAVHIRACLEAVFAQTERDLRVTVVDNGSEDDTLANLGAWAGPDFTLIQNPTNEGYAAAHNKAIDATDGDFVLTLNPDVILTPTFLEHALAAIEAGSENGSACGKLLRVSPDAFRANGPPLVEFEAGQALLIDSAGLGLHKNRRQFLRGYLQPAADTCAEGAAIFGPDGAAALYRRAMLEETAIGGETFDELFVTHKEDVDLAWRAQLFGWQSAYTPQAVGYHLRGFRPGERRRMPPVLRRHSVKNRWLMLAKNDLLGLYLRHLPHILAYDAGILGYMLLFEQRSLPALWDLIRLLPELRRRRRAVQHGRIRDSRYMRQWFT